MNDIQNKLNSAVTKFVNEGVIIPISTVSSRDRAKLANLYKYIQDRFGEEFNIRFNQNSIVIIPGDQPINAKSNSNAYSGYPEDGIIFENEQAAPEFDWASNMAGLIKFMKGRGVKLDPLPEIILNKEPQMNGLLDKTGTYDKDNNVIELYIAGRHPKDVMRSAVHELYHVHQAHAGQINNVSTEQITKDKNLKDLEGECFREGNLLFREYTESLKN